MSLTANAWKQSGAEDTLLFEEDVLDEDEVELLEDELDEDWLDCVETVESTSVRVADPVIDEYGLSPLAASGPMVTGLVPPLMGKDEHAPLVSAGVAWKQESMRS